MTKLTTLPNTAPFAPEQIAALDQVIGAASEVQRAWLSGFLAGLDAAEGKGAVVPAAATAEKPKLLVLYATESGNSEALATKTKTDAAKRGFAARVLDMADADINTLKAAGTIVAIVSTWGDGEPPQRAAPFYRALMGEDAPRLEGVKFAVLALGDSSYAQFCETGRVVDERFAALGAERVAARIDLDLDYEAPAKTWLNATLELLAPKDAGSVIHVDFQKPVAAGGISKTAPFAAEITAHHKLTSDRADSETFHVELSLAGSGLTYEPGDAIGIVPENDPALVGRIIRAAGLKEDAALSEALTRRYDISTLTVKQIKDYAALTGDKTLAALADDNEKRNGFIDGRQIIDLLETFPHALEAEPFTALLRPLAPRYYSVASSQKLVEEEAHLTIARLAYKSAGRERVGVASGMAADRRKTGGSVDVFVKANPHFRLPKDAATPIVMIGAGTGIAPYRGFLQEREALGLTGKSWLVFGHRHFLYDFLYQLEIQAWLESGVLGRLDLASSRDQPEKRYVQHVLWEQRDALRAQLAEGATLYLCGDAKHMARDVDAVLMRILADGKDAREGQAALDALVTAGRYKKDVY
jgi:sulfite reductase (NADPH) flavoprotein alpha-component